MLKATFLSLLISLIATITYGQIPEKAFMPVVTVTVNKTKIAKDPLGRGGSATESAYQKTLDNNFTMNSGTGFIIKQNGKPYVVASADIVAYASDETGSIFINTTNREKYAVKYIGGDSFYNIAVLEFIDEPGSELPAIQFRENAILVGEPVYAIEAPLGEYPYSVANGVISAKNGMFGGMTGKYGYLQTTIKTISDNSGSPVIDKTGKLVGIYSHITFADAPKGEEMIHSYFGFALEAGISKKIIGDIINNNGRAKRAFVGVELSQKFEYKYTGPYNYILVKKEELPVITGTIPGSPASSVLADKINWQVTKIDGKEIHNIEQALGELEKAKPGSTLILSLQSGSSSTDVVIKTGELKEIELEHMVRFILGQNKNIVVDFDHSQVQFKMKESNFFYHDNYGVSKYKMSGKSMQDNYYILSAGISTESSKNMWLTRNLSEMGAAFRLTGTSGLIDFYVIKSGEPDENIQLLRQYLSNDENIIKSTLWY